MTLKSRTMKKGLGKQHRYALRVPEAEWRQFEAKCKTNGWDYAWVIRKLIRDFSENVKEVSPLPREQ